MNQTDRIAIFVEVIREGSFAAAAGKLGLTPSAISKQVMNLEDSLRTKLLVRTTRSLQLTEAGAIYYDHAQRALEDLNEANSRIKDLASKPEGPLKISVPASFGHAYLAESLSQFALDYPNVHLNIAFEDRHVDLISERYDLALRIGSMPDSSLITKILAPCPLIVVGSPSLAKQYMPKTPKDLEGLPFIVYARQGQRNLWDFISKEGKTGSIPLTPKLYTDNAEMMTISAMKGLGFCIVPIFAAEKAIKEGNLIHLLPDYESNPKRSIHLLYPERRYMPNRTRMLINMLSKICNGLSWACD